MSKAEIGKLQKTFRLFGEKIERQVIQKQRECAEICQQYVKESAPIRTGRYAESIQVSDTTVNGGVIETKVYSALTVGGDNEKWKNVPLGCLLEWGTGIKGMATNQYNHGYSYRTTPWVYYDEYLEQWVTTSGIVARPHWYPASRRIVPVFKRKMREAVWQSIKETFGWTK